MKAFYLLFSLVFCGISFADPIEIKPAVELIFSATPDKGLQLEFSNDLSEWQPFEGPILGQKGTVHRLVPATDAARAFKLTVNTVRNINSLIEPIRTANKVPGMACAVILSNRVIALGAVGLRKSDVPGAPILLHDLWHHGSNTKSMTATLAALLVEDGKIQWTTTLADVFPEFAAKMNPQWRGVTLDWLCSNRSGAPEDLTTSGIWTQLQNFRGTAVDSRELLLKLLTVLPPKSTPGTQYEYSNAGFALAGHMLERVTNVPWEELLTERLFVPLEMSTAGFGVPGTPRYIDQPWGHQLSGSNPIAFEPGPSADNPPAIGPAGTVHCSVIDMAKYVLFHMAGHRSGTALLTKESFLKLHTPVPSNANYAYGWGAADRPWAGGQALYHAGSNTLWYSIIWMAPNVQFAVVAVCNIAASSGPNPGATATDQVVAKMIQTFLTN